MAMDIPVYTGTAFTSGTIPEMRGASKAVRGSKGKFESRNWVSLQFGMPLSSRNDLQREALQAEKLNRSKNRIQQVIGWSEHKGNGSVSDTVDATTVQMGKYYLPVPYASNNILTSALKEQRRQSDANIILQSIEARKQQLEAEAIWEEAEESQRRELALPVRRIDAKGKTIARLDADRFIQKQKDKELYHRTLKMSAQQKKDEIDVVAKGTSKALKQSDAMTSSKFTSLASALAIGRVAQRAGGYVLSAAKSSTTEGQKVINEALGAGVDPEVLAKWSFAIKRFGGSEADATRMFTMISHLRQKALEGDSDAYLEAAKRYGLDVTGSGPGGIKTQDEILQEVHRLLSGNELSQMQKWGLAQTLSMPASVRRVFTSTDEELNKFTKDPTIPSGYDFQELDKQEQEWNVAKARFSNAIVKLAANTNIIEYWADKLSSVSAFISERADIEKENEESLARGVPIVRRHQDFPTSGFGASSGITGFLLNSILDSYDERKIKNAIEVYGTVDIRGANGETVGEAPIHGVDSSMIITR